MVGVGVVVRVWVGVWVRVGVWVGDWVGVGVRVEVVRSSSSSSGCGRSSGGVLVVEVRVVVVEGVVLWVGVAGVGIE